MVQGDLLVMDTRVYDACIRTHAPGGGALSVMNSWVQHMEQGAREFTMVQWSLWFGTLGLQVLDRPREFTIRSGAFRVLDTRVQYVRHGHLECRT